MKSITSISHLQWLFPPFGALRHHLARWEGSGTSQATKGGISLAHRAVGLFSDARRAVVWF